MTKWTDSGGGESETATHQWFYPSLKQWGTRYWVTLDLLFMHRKWKSSFLAYSVTSSRLLTVTCLYFLLCKVAGCNTVNGDYTKMMSVEHSIRSNTWWDLGEETGHLRAIWPSATSGSLDSRLHGIRVLFSCVKAGSGWKNNTQTIKWYQAQEINVTQLQQCQPSPRMTRNQLSVCAPHLTREGNILNRLISSHY